ncbi:hypothetical protein [Agrobacterium vitis]|nr:hypothetical protein [Agrobacterium vitis]
MSIIYLGWLFIWDCLVYRLRIGSIVIKTEIPTYATSFPLKFVSQ